MNKLIAIIFTVSLFTLGGCKEKILEIIPVITMTDISLPTTGRVRHVDFPTLSIGFASSEVINVGTFSTIHSTELYRTTNGGSTWSKISTLENFGKGMHTKYISKAFTEKGLYMRATILKSAKATQTTLTIVEPFARIKSNS